MWIYFPAHHLHILRNVYLVFYKFASLFNCVIYIKFEIYTVFLFLILFVEAMCLYTNQI